MYKATATHHFDNGPVGAHRVVQQKQYKEVEQYGVDRDEEACEATADKDLAPGQDSAVVDLHVAHLWVVVGERGGGQVRGDGKECVLGLNGANNVPLARCGAVIQLNPTYTTGQAFPSYQMKPSTLPSPLTCLSTRP